MNREALLHTYFFIRVSILIWLCGNQAIGGDSLLLVVVIIIIMAGMAVFNVAGYLIEERRRWPVITASPRGQCSK